MSGDAAPSLRGWRDRAIDYAREVPFLTAAVAVGCVVGYLAQGATGWPPLGAVCLSPARVARGQLWRLATAPLSHLGPVHLLANLLAFVPLAGHLERRAGTLELLAVAAYLAAAGGAAHSAVGVAAAAVTGRPAPCAAGLSGVVLGLVAVEAHASGFPSRSFFGLFDVPAKAYPYALAAAFQLLLPRASLLGHLGGVAAGHLWGAAGAGLAGPALRRAAGRADGSWLARAAPNWVPAGGRELLPTARPAAARGGGDGAFRAALGGGSGDGPAREPLLGPGAREAAAEAAERRATEAAGRGAPARGGPGN